MKICRWRRVRVGLVAAMLGTVPLAGCGGIDGVELNGGIFDALGISGSSNVNQRDPVVPQRAGLVLPPQRDALPVPGSAPAPEALAAVPGAWPVDPEDRKKQQASVAKKQHDEFCAAAVQRKRALGDQTPTDGPLGRCESSALSLFGLSGRVN